MTDLVISLVSGTSISENIKKSLKNKFPSCVVEEVNFSEGHILTEEESVYFLKEICDFTHSHCSKKCPVFKLNNYTVPDTQNSGYGCDCFKSGKEMLKFINAKLLEDEDDEPETCA